MELNRNLLRPHGLLRGCTRNASGTVFSIKFTFSACVEGDVEETKGDMRILLLMLLQLLLLRKLKLLRRSFQGVFRCMLN